MFAEFEGGASVSKAEFKTAAAPLRTRLLKAQHALREAGLPVVIIVSGVEGAGRNEVVNHLQEWLDPRGVRTTAFTDDSDEERERPGHWRFWRQLPARGDIAIFFGSWYTQPIVWRTFDEIDDGRFSRLMDRVTHLEQMLSADGTLVLKLWFHISRKEQQRRLKRIEKKHERKLTYFERAYSKRYERFAAVATDALQATDTPQAPWHIIDAGQDRARDLAAGRLLLAQFRRHLAQAAKAKPKQAAKAVEVPTGALASVALGAKLTRSRYEKQLKKLQARLNELSWDAREAKRSTVVVFEGWDAAGKGGAIRRLTHAMDARLYQVIPIAAPTDEELAHHYLWRFWRHIPRDGYVRLFDRSWYGRVLVERVEGFAKTVEWQRAYTEINAFERQLTEHGTTVAKFWLHLSPEEQLHRFEARRKVSYKQHKITDEDWRNRKQWPAYSTAVEEMVARCSPENAPWTLVAADDKRHARIQVLETLCARMEQSLKG